MEAAASDTTLMGNAEKGGGVYSKKSQNRNPKHREKQSCAKCYRCGKVGHNPQECHYKLAKCFNCGKCKDQKGTLLHEQKHLADVSEELKDNMYSQLNGLDDKVLEKAMIDVSIDGTVVPVVVIFSKVHVTVLFPQSVSPLWNALTTVRQPQTELPVV